MGFARQIQQFGVTMDEHERFDHLPSTPTCQDTLIHILIHDRDTLVQQKSAARSGLDRRLPQVARQPGRMAPIVWRMMATHDRTGEVGQLLGTRFATRGSWHRY